ncbi:HAMP domain-containing protein [Mycetocola sp. BIGb0189]|uniref:DUF6286 domain-containing protein n=1 Tax=Mycetocola sp. BIGb0189 TaxID=2940604 RepID=UPI0021683A72|nr:DUF6286 domain-containing protein [Mycetocola sp. BIGb0189]MCS4275925.1 HAMP domain-containing protein [Mycetocola sp. BIGb0189]
MSIDTQVYTRVLRRESHDSRTAPAVVTASLLALLLGALLVLGIWMIIDDRVATGVAEFLSGRHVAFDVGAVALGGGILLLLLAILLIWLALAPGRRDRRSRSTDRLAILVDNGVLADTVADRVAEAEGLDRSNVSVVVGRTRASVHVTPTSGVALNPESVREVARETLTAAGFVSEVRVRIAERGVVS